jgi:hypothetical protein
MYQIDKINPFTEMLVKSKTEANDNDDTFSIPCPICKEDNYISYYFDGEIGEKHCEHFLRYFNNGLDFVFKKLI